MNRIIFGFLFFSFLSTEAQAQTVIVRKRDINVNEPTVSVGRISPVNGSIYYTRYIHALKVNPSALIAGDVPVSYERKMSDYFSLEAGAGLTTFNYTEDVLRGFRIRENGETISLPSYSMNFNAKFFPDGNAFKDGYYIAFNLGYRDYNQKFYTTSSAAMDTTFNEGFNWSDLGFTMGYQSRPSERMIFDWYIGAGIRKKRHTVTEYEQTFDPATGLFVGEYVEKITANTAPALLGGVKISVLFR